ncbi:hypothetical protein FV242_05880 [Methylobacterium sp. WL64]|uniref:type II TA system antitoxin MqsA family protein n=1 Tax=Methylobacterium sp. WL64 TaxID=2603894 RepID=UPI0011CC6A5D|nr:type II TA system antitoxin MqsA family protein [Methylobacterium sp. WL64]TXN04880.1 hypothetical protein FV242_05880 [Methylobacterium sp. WL64]
MTFDVCLACGETAVEERVASVTVERLNRKVTITDRHMCCTACGNVSYRGDQITAHELAVANAIRDEDGLLTAAELSLVRSKYGLRQTDMEQILSTGPKTWTRWERGKVVQSKSTDKLIRAISEDPYLARDMMLQAGVVNPEAEAVFAQIERDHRMIVEARFRARLGSGADVDSLVEIATEGAFEALHEVRVRTRKGEMAA